MYESTRLSEDGDIVGGGLNGCGERSDNSTKCFAYVIGQLLSVRQWLCKSSNSSKQPLAMITCTLPYIDIVQPDIIVVESVMKIVN